MTTTHPKPAPADRLWSHAEAAAYLGVPELTLHKWNSQGGDVPRSYRVGRYRKYRKVDLDAWLATRASGGGGSDAA